jgi:hypothetical protein
MQYLVLKDYPRDIKATTERIAGLERDIARYASHKDEEFSMTIAGKIFGKDEKKEAEKAILNACDSSQGIKNAVTLGEYKGFTMMLNHSTIHKGFELTLRSDGLTHHVELGDSQWRNLAKIDSVLGKISERLEIAKERLENIVKQAKIAKEELNRPFPQEQELQEKNARLAELNILLNMDNTKEQTQEQEPDLTVPQEYAVGQTAGTTTFSRNEYEEGDITAPVSPKMAVSTAEIISNRDGLSFPAQALNENTTIEDIQKNLQAGQSVAYHLKDKETILKGYFVRSDETAVKISSGGREISVRKDKGNLEILSEQNFKIRYQENANIEIPIGGFTK